MELTHIEHLGIAVKSIEACLPYYEGVLGLNLSRKKVKVSTISHSRYLMYRQL